MNNLNKEQFRASLPGGGVSLVVAGAGTGKTKTLVEKVKNIITEGKISPENILILTFSRKAALEIKDRIKSYIGDNAERIMSGTFHSFCLAFLRGNGKQLLEPYGYQGPPSIMDEEDRERIKTDILRNYIDRFLGLPINVISGLLDNLDSIDKHTLKRYTHLGILHELNELNIKFKDYKRSKNLIDFGDMIDYTIDILDNDRPLREKTIRQFQYIFVDEFQDTSEDNFRLLKLLLPEDNSNLFLVGDDWQSIYGFRGARIEYILKMKKFFPEVMIHKLMTNYRSRKEIISLSNNFIKNNRYRTSKRLKSFKGIGGVVKDYQVDNFEHEIEIIKNILKNNADSSSDIAILYRNNRQGKYILQNIQDIEAANRDRIKLMTIHSSKGLEFDTVIIAGVSDDIIPDSTTDIEEERRLFYVALTRAKEKLYIIHHKSKSNKLSIFAKELRFSGNNSAQIL